MHLYHLTLQKPTGVIAIAYGSFSEPKVHEIALACGSSLEVIRPDGSGKLRSIGRSETFGQLRSLAPFRLTGSKRDYLIVGSDSGRVTILQFDGTSGRFKQIHCETFGKSGVRRIVPGQYTVADPRGRACLLGAIEKQKFVYVLNRDSSENLTVSSPLEAHKGSIICYDIVALDVGFENPVFAALERPYEAPGKKILVYYELDLGLNHAMRKQAMPVDDSASLLCSVPGGGDGPSGTLVCSTGKVCYFGLSKDHPVLEAALPYRFGGKRGQTTIVSWAVHKHKQRGRFFFLLCTERADLLKVELMWEEESVSELVVKYLDTIPYASAAMCVMRTGFLFTASEFGDHYFYQFQGVGVDDDPAGGYSSSKEGISSNDIARPARGTVVDLTRKLPFHPRSELENLLLVDTLPSMAPVLQWQQDDFAGELDKQLAVTCGRGKSASLRLLRRGFAVQEMAVSELPATPSAVFTVKENRNDDYDQFIIVSFLNATLVLRIAETVEEVSQSGILGDVPTLAAALIGEDSLVQVHANGIRLVKKNAAVTEWKTPSGSIITAVATNPNQVAVALSNSDLVYFELDTESGNLDEIEKLDGAFTAPGANGHAEFSSEKATPTLAFARPGTGRTRGLFLAISDGVSNIARLLSIQADGSLQSAAVQALPGPAESLAILQVDTDHPVLLVGLRNGMLLKLKIDPLSGQIIDKRSRFLGVKPVQLQHIRAGGIDTCFALSTTPWILHPQGWGRTALSPLCSYTLDRAASFSSEQCPEGFVAVHKNALRILTLEDPDIIVQAVVDDAAPGVVFNSAHAKLPVTPRRLLNMKHPDRDSAGLVLTLETDQRSAKDDAAPGAMTNTLPAGSWASTIRLLSLNRSETANEQEAEAEEEETRSAVTLDKVELAQDECALTGCVTTFPDRPGELFVCVSVARGLLVDATSPLDRREKVNKPPVGELRLYQLIEKKLSLLHSTTIEKPCYALAAFHGRILAGVGDTLRLYELGKKKLLKKTEYRHAVPNLLNAIATIGDRIFVGDVQESVHLLQYKASENRLLIIADDNVPRWITALAVVDYHTVFCADKFGNVFVLRIPAELSDSLESDPTGGKLVDPGSSAPHKLSVEASFHVGSIVHTLSKVSLRGNSEVLLYGTIGGAIGVLAPLPLRSDVDLFQHLEISIREAAPPLCGRDHLSYRSYYYPVRNVIDGDMIERLPYLKSDQQKALADEVDRSVMEVLRKIEDVRESIL